MSTKTATSTSAVTETQSQTSETREEASVCLNLTKPKCEKKVGWSTETVDNENLGRKKSKCCCIYKKPHKFDESSSSSEGEDECDNCHGHVELRKSQSQHAPPKPPVVE